MGEINLFTEDIIYEYQEIHKLKNWIISVIKSENYELENLNVIFTSDNYLLEMNKNYLNHDYFTDVITFDYVENNKLSGDIFISIDRVGENAKNYKVNFLHELNRIIVHGLLHLLGYKDKTKTEKKIMTSKENFYLDKI